MGEALYTIGTDQQQAWMKKIVSHLEDMVTLNREHILSRYYRGCSIHVAKSFYQVYPEVRNIKIISKETRNPNPMISGID